MSSKGMRRRRRMARLTAEDNAKRLLSASVEVSFRAAPGDGEGGDEKPAGPPRFEIDAYNGGTMKPSYQFWPTPVVIDLAGIKASNQLPVLLDHWSDQILGQSEKVEVTTGPKGGIKLSGIITGDISDKADPAGKVMLHAKNGFKWKASVGIDPTKFERIDANQVVTVNGREFRGPLYVLRAGTLDEVSLLSVGADKSSAARIAAKSTQESMEMDFHDWLKAKGFDPQNISDAQRDFLLTQFKAETGSKNAGPPSEDDKKRKADDDNKKLDATGIGAKLVATRRTLELHMALEATAAQFLDAYPQFVDGIEQELNAAKGAETNPEMLKYKLDSLCSRAPDNSLRSRADNLGDPQHRSEIVEAAMYLSLGLENATKHFSEPVLAAAEKKWPYRISLCEMLGLAARINGFGDVSHRNPRGLIEASFPPAGFRGSGPSTMDVSGILSNLANKALLDHFNAIDQSWRDICAVRSVKDFKQITSYSLTGDMTYIEVPPGGEIKHGTLGEETYTNQAKTFALMLAIDRRDIINDDLGAFAQVLRKLGRGGGLKLNEVVWGKFLDNAAVFTAARGNFDDGAETALSITALTAAEVLFMDLTDPDGNPLGFVPARLAVPTPLKRTAMKIMNSVETRVETPTTGAASVEYGTTNTFQNDYKIVSSPYMSNSRLTGYSALKWYLLANPADVAVVEACFLNGKQTPTIEQSQPSANRLGIDIVGYFDFGAAIQEYRAGVAMKGEV